MSQTHVIEITRGKTRPRGSSTEVERSWADNVQF